MLWWRSGTLLLDYTGSVSLPLVSLMFRKLLLALVVLVTLELV